MGHSQKNVSGAGLAERQAQRRAQKAANGPVRVVLHRLHPGQVRIAEAPERFKTVMCGRRFGKTALAIRKASDVALQGKYVGWFAPTYKYALEAWRELLQRLGPIVDRQNEQDRRMELSTGGVIEIWTLDSPDPGRSRKYHLAVVDEAGLVPDLLAIWQESIRPTLVDYRGDALVLGTPKGRRHGFVQLFNRGLNPEEVDFASFRARTLDNPYIPPEEIEQARRELPPEVFAQEFEGIPTDDGANPFGLEAIRACVAAQDGEEAATAGDPVVYGVDLARSMDYTVVVGLDAWRRVVHLERWQAPWAVTKERIRRRVGGVPIVADATGVGDAIVADLQGMGVSVTPHVFSQSSKLRLMQRLVAAFQGKELQLSGAEADRWLLGELEAFEFTYTASGVRYEAPRGEHDDGVMALALALYGWDRVQGVVPEAPAGLRLVGDDPNVPGEGADGVMAMASFAAPGDFATQLPAGW